MAAINTAWTIQPWDFCSNLSLCPSLPIHSVHPSGTPEIVILWCSRTPWPSPPNSIVRFCFLLSSVIIFSLVICMCVSLAHHLEVNEIEIPSLPSPCPPSSCDFLSCHLHHLCFVLLPLPFSLFPLTPFLLFPFDLLLLYYKYHFPPLLDTLLTLFHLIPIAVTIHRSIISILQDPMSQLRFGAFITTCWVMRPAFTSQLVGCQSLNSSPNTVL